MDAQVLPLTQSFRFGPAIAAVANSLLAITGETMPLRGFKQIPSVIRPLKPREIPYTILCRTNLQRVRYALAGLQKNQPVAVVGGTKNVVALLQAAHQLWRSQGRSVPPRHPLLVPFKTWDEVEQAAETEAGSELKPVIRLVARYGDDLPTVAEQLNNTGAEDQAEVVISTVHQAKGREWPRVQLAGDFRSLKPGKHGKPPPAEEVNLAYVAVTRAQHVLAVQRCPAVLQRLEPE